MCGICGVVDKRGETISEQRLRTMNNLAAHRGPDGEGYRIRPGLGLGHRRLSILDLSPRGAQPMSWDDRYWIVFNGEIYNYREVRADLERLGRRFHTGTDTEVILAAYAEWGTECFSRFNGMWALAIHDEREETLLLSRDRFGVKPLYLVDTEHEFAFASEIKQLISFLPRVAVDRTVLLKWVVTGYEGHRPGTFFDGVTRLLPGHWLRISLRDGRRTLQRWYDLRPDPSLLDASIDDAATRLRDLLTDAIGLRLRSDVQVGTSLSGGLDSSATSAIASALYHRQTGQRFLGIHARATEAAIDESAFAQAVARHADIELSTVTPSVDDFAGSVDEVIHAQEEPFGSPSVFMGWSVCREARARNCPVMLNGQGGDEVLLGYERYFVAVSRSLSWWSSMVEAVRQSRNSRLSLMSVLLQRIYFPRPAVRIKRLIDRTFVKPSYAAEADMSTVVEAAEAFRSPLDLQRFEILQQLPHLLRYEDRNSMQHSIETRLPFLDYRLVEAAIAMPLACKIHHGWTKFVLRRALHGILPDEVLWRKTKIGFEAPTATWLRAIQPRILEEVAGSRIIAEVTDRKRLLDALPRAPLVQQWLYFNLAVWERRYGVEWA